jgi:hypothetical protein
MWTRKQKPFLYKSLSCSMGETHESIDLLLPKARVLACMNGRVHRQIDLLEFLEATLLVVGHQSQSCYLTHPIYYFAGRPWRSEYWRFR